MLRKRTSVTAFSQGLGCLFHAFSTAASSPGNSYYEVLGVDAAASPDQVKAAFRQRAKELHPDLNAQWSAADGEAFLQLVTAYEVLSDPEQRQLYDMSQDQQLPGVLRRAASAAAPSGSCSQSGQQGLTSWRYGLADWAAQGPSSSEVLTADSKLRWSVMSALARHRKELEQDLHTALVTAFLGPQLDVIAGQLPAAFEADERAEPSLTSDLLHLVHGRALLGVIRIREQLKLQGDHVHTAGELIAGNRARLPALISAAASSTASTGCGTAVAANTAHPDEVQQRRQPYVGQQVHARTLASHAQEVDQAYPRSITGVRQGVNAAADDDDEEVSEAAWREILQQQHPLHGYYDWALPAAEPAWTTKAAPDNKLLLEHDVQPDTAVCSTSCDHDDGDVPTDHDHSRTFPARGCDGTDALGGRVARAAWEESCLQQACQGPDVREQPCRVSQNSTEDYTGTKGLDDVADEPASAAASSTQTDQEQPKQQRQSSAGGRFARTWRWLRTPSRDWVDSEWCFDDSCEGVLVLEMTDDTRRVTAVAVRDETQDRKPCKVYVGGTFVAAVLDDIVMEPMTGRLMAVLYRFYTPGVHHLYFYLPSKGASRVLARLQRRWMPPSSTWLFPPRSDAHNTGGWAIEWEGHDCQHKPGWLHPAVLTLTAACYSRDMELRRASSSVQQFHHVAGVLQDNIDKLKHWWEAVRQWCFRTS